MLAHFYQYFLMLADIREVPFTCMHICNCLKSLKMVGEISDKNIFFYYCVLNPFLKLTRLDHDVL